jgi:hypothetical protein
MTVLEQTGRGRVLHLRFEGRSLDVPLRDLEIPQGASDGEIRGGLARYLDVAPQRFAEYVIERHENGNWTVRPEAVFG